MFERAQFYFLPHPCTARHLFSACSQHTLSLSMSNTTQMCAPYSHTTASCLFRAAASTRRTAIFVNKHMIQIYYPALELPATKQRTHAYKGIGRAVWHWVRVMMCVCCVHSQPWPTCYIFVVFDRIGYNAIHVNQLLSISLEYLRTHSHTQECKLASQNTRAKTMATRNLRCRILCCYRFISKINERQQRWAASMTFRASKIV